MTDLPIPTQAYLHTGWCPTSRLRWAVSSRTSTDTPVLQQEWEIQWSNNFGAEISTQWVDVPMVVISEEGAQCQP